MAARPRNGRFERIEDPAALGPRDLGICDQRQQLPPLAAAGARLHRRSDGGRRRAARAQFSTCAGSPRWWPKTYSAPAAAACSCIPPTPARAMSAAACAMFANARRLAFVMATAADGWRRPDPVARPDLAARTHLRLWHRRQGRPGCQLSRPARGRDLGAAFPPAACSGADPCPPSIPSSRSSARGCGISTVKTTFEQIFRRKVSPPR